MEQTDRPIDDRDRAAVVDLDIDASPEAVWRALTTEQGLAPWMGEGARLVAEPGGAVVLPDPVGGETRRGRVDRIEADHRLDFTWWPALRPAERTTVTITVVPTGPGSRVRVVERPPARLVASAAAVQGGVETTAPTGPPARKGTNRLPIGLWAWRLAVLSVATSLSRV